MMDFFPFFFHHVCNIFLRYIYQKDEKLKLDNFQYALTKDVEYKRPAIVYWNGTNKSSESKSNDGANHQTLNDKHCINISFMLNNSSQCDFVNIDKTKLSTRVMHRIGF